MKDESKLPKNEQILSKFKKAREARQHKDSLWHELDLFDRGEQWANGGAPWIPKPVTNYINLVKTTKRAAFAIENPMGMLRPLSEQDKEGIEFLQRVYEFEWKRVKARKYVRDVIETGKLLGTGIMQMFYDGDEIGGGTGTLYKGEIKMRQLDPASFYPDPSAHRIEDCKFIHIVERKSVAWLKKHPIYGKKMGQVESRKVADNERGEIYNRDNQQTYDGMIDFHTHYEKVANKEGGFTIQVTYLAGEHIVHEQKEVRPNRYPFSIYYDYPQRQDFWGKSTADLVLDNQKLVNKVEAIMALIGTQLQNPQRIVSKQSGINPQVVAKYGSAPGHVFVANGEPSRAMHWATPPQIPTALFNLADRARENIREITGITQAYMGESVGSLQTSSGVSQLIDRATMRDRDQMFDVELFIEDLSRLFIAFITEFYTEERYIRIKEEYEEDYRFEEYIGSDFNGLDFDFEVDVSAQAPVTRQRLQEEAEKLIQYQGQYSQSWGVSLIEPEEFIEMSDFTNKYQMIRRMKREREANRAAMALEVANMMFEAMQAGASAEELQQMGEAMVAQQEEQLSMGMGSTASPNTGAHQMSQGGIG